ncbi:Glu/Leu/Phe/Val dehydrogenase family protein [Neoaquamicrobium sediminum]|uniref:Glu/Leu/Phe/Val dehydrogenase family protein n=1 Tax=Neoaquamicrobium sediminum TaxID=1849104 RepID=UPI00156325AB|nr:Glu/Leu/Phe/Val dehydrogenase family protein [Mesorhizobium sediminum]NRC53825.1 amino acid dehydrogenase [Mesorhizobium sediminum]
MVNKQHVAAPEGVHTLRDPDSGLEGLIVLHSTALGPAAGGCRLLHYQDASLMRADAFRLAEGMSYKNALAGRYITAEDVGTSVEDMQAVSEKTRFVAGLPSNSDGPGGDPSPWTAQGVFVSMETLVRRHLSKDLSDCVVAVQGLGHVGHSLARMLHQAGARMIVADVSEQNVRRAVAETGAAVVSAEQILSVEADVLAPCALGAIFDETSIGTIRARIICGAANNQLATPDDGARLARRGILYAPDYVVNAGGIINVAGEYFGWTEKDTQRRIADTGNRLIRVLDHASATGVAPNQAADELARAKIAAGSSLFLADSAL